MTKRIIQCSICHKNSFNNECCPSHRSRAIELRNMEDVKKAYVQKTCKAEGCRKKAISRGMCNLHYTRWRKPDYWPWFKESL